MLNVQLSTFHKDHRLHFFFAEQSALEQVGIFLAHKIDLAPLCGF